MLDDLSAQILGRSLVAALGPEFFLIDHTLTGTGGQLSHSVTFNIPLIQALQCRSAIWKIMYVYDSTDDLLVFKRLCELAIAFLGTVSVDVHGIEGARELIQASDLVYAPAFCQKYKIRPTLQPPSTATVALDMITHFSVSVSPFSPQAYYTAIRNYDPAIYLGSSSSESV